MEAQEAERQQIVRELQYEIGQDLFTVKVNLQAALTLPNSFDRSIPVNESIQIIDRVCRQLNGLSNTITPPHPGRTGIYSRPPRAYRPVRPNAPES